MDPFVLGMLLFLLCLVLFIAILLKQARKEKEQTLYESAPTQSQEGRKDLATLEYHVRKLEKDGYSRQTIMKKLTAVGWEEHLVDLVLYEVHKPHNRLKALRHYVQQQLLKAKPKEIIKENLLSAGWDEEIVDVALGLEPMHEGRTGEHGEAPEMVVLFNFLH
ncbi:hypothetical protein HY497_01535 [Candidatus Woesearchaeota archaeon]|nr:hypothetical protein [Candidatus Woesearchaeota archaeon]